jgi:hypothetical protein
VAEGGGSVTSRRRRVPGIVHHLVRKNYTIFALPGIPVHELSVITS